MYFSTLEYCLLGCQIKGPSCKAIQYVKSNLICSMGEVNEYPVKTSQELGASLTYSKRPIVIGKNISCFLIYLIKSIQKYVVH